MLPITFYRVFLSASKNGTFCSMDKDFKQLPQVSFSSKVSSASEGFRFI